jgi:hypothetical protein
MAKYLFIQDAFVNGSVYLPAGSVASTQDVGGILLTGWHPGAYVDPLDNAAATAFFNAGVQLPFRQWAGVTVAGACRWQQIAPPSGQYQLTGIGSSLGTASGPSTPGG